MTTAATGTLMKRRSAGRPRLDPLAIRDQRVVTKLTRDERAVLEEAAMHCETSVSNLLRQLILDTFFDEADGGVDGVAAWLLRQRVQRVRSLHLA